MPDFSRQLQAAMDYAGLTAHTTSAALSRLGLRTSEQHVRRLLRGTGPNSRANPTLLLIAGLAQVCGVPAQWFFGRGDDLPAMLERYAVLAEQRRS